MYDLYSLLQDFLILDTKIVAYSAGTLSVMPERELGNQAQILKYSPCSCSLYVHILFIFTSPSPNNENGAKLHHHHPPYCNFYYDIYRGRNDGPV